MSTTVKSSTGLAAYMMVTGSAKEAFDGGFIIVYDSATIPATADAAVEGDSIWTISLNGDGTGLTWDATAVGRALVKPTSASWSGATAAGTATYFRIVGPTDDGTLSTTQPRIQGVCGSTAGVDFYLADPNLIEDVALDAKSIAAFSVALPTN